MDRRRFLQGGVAVIGALALPGGPVQAGLSDVRVFVNGPIHSMTPRGRLSALAIAGDRIVAVDDAARALLKLGARRVDLAGRALYPGFIDAHSHWFGDFWNFGFGNPAWSSVSSEVEGVRKAIESGWTSITEHFASPDRVQALQDVDTAGDLPVRVSAYLPANYRFDMFDPWYLDYTPRSQLTPRVRVAGVKFFVDGGLTFLLREPYEPCEQWPQPPGSPVPDPTFTGEWFWDDTQLRGRLIEADRAGFQITVHCSGDAATDRMLDQLEAVDPTFDNPRRHNLTHLILLHDDQIRRLRQQGIVANIQLGWFHAAERERLECLLGSRVENIGRWRDLLAAGVRTTGSTDFPWGVPIIGSVLRTLYNATTRIGPNGEQPAPWMERQRLTTRQAIRLLTSAAAWALNEEERVGSLRRGLLADLTVFSGDPLAVEPAALLGLDVALAVVGGKVEHVHPDHADLAAALS